MDIVIDTSALIAVIIGEPERDAIVSITAGQTLIGPGSIPWEVGNAFTAMIKQRRIEVADARRGLEIFDNIPLRYVNINMAKVVSIAAKANIYAYDAYFLDCAVQCRAPLLTLDRPLRRVAEGLGITLINPEV